MSQNKIGITYRDTFDDFLESLDPQRRHTIETAIIRYADGEIALDPRDCDHIPERKKILISEANAVVYYDDKNTEWEFIGGLENHTRVA